VQSALTPELALALVRELSGDVVAVELRRADGVRIAGDPATGPDVIRVQDGGVELAVAVGPRGLPGLARHDAEAALRSLSRPSATG
jgi:hypothetical protein